MSLFRTKEWWRTECGANESFDGRSLLVAPLFGADNGDVIVIGSHSGYLRIYSPSSQWNEEEKSPTGYKSTDLIIEAQVGDCIVDIKAGKFVSGSQDLRLAILLPNKLVVYAATLHKGTMECGDHCDLEIAYEHNLTRFPSSLTCGAFGGARGRDFLCIQCLDGTLIFYEQESYAFTQTLRNRLLPEPIVYVARNDVFITSSSSWMFECYRYQSMAEFGRNQSDSEGTRSLEPDWSFNIGEAVLGIDVVTLSSFEVGIVVLGEKSLHCFKDNCVTLKYSKRLEYKALCFCAYVIEPDGKLMVLVISDTNTLMIYEGTTLKWSAQLPFPSVAVARARFQHLDGVIVILSDEGLLEACYLGSEPSMFIAPPLQRRGFDYVAAEEELLEIRRAAKKNKAAGDKAAGAPLEAELIINVIISPEFEPCPYNAREDNKDDNESRQSLMCKIAIELSSYTTIQDVQICIDSCPPMVATKNCFVISNLCDRHTVHTAVYSSADFPPASSEVRITVTYETDRGSRVVQKTTNLPLKLLLRACPPEGSKSIHSVIIKCSETLVGFTQLFPEFVSDNIQRQNPNAFGLQHVNGGGVVTITCGTVSNRYRVQSNDGLSMALVIEQLVNRLKDRTSGSIGTSIGQSHVQFLHSQIEAHFLVRQEIDRIKVEMGLLTTQLRNIEKKMLRAVRERNTRSLPDTGLPFLLDSTYQSIFKLLDDLATARAERERAGHNLWCAVKLLLSLLRLNLTEDKYAMVEAALGFEPQIRDEIDWEEIADVALSAVLRATSKKQGNLDTKPLSLNKFTSTKDLAKLKKRLFHVVERLDSSRDSDITENETLDSNNIG